MQRLRPRAEALHGRLRVRWPIDSSARFLLAGTLGFLSIILIDALIGGAEKRGCSSMKSLLMREGGVPRRAGAR